VSNSVYLLALAIEFCLKSVDLIKFSSELYFLQGEVSKQFIFTKGYRSFLEFCSVFEFLTEFYFSERVAHDMDILLILKREL
jgi:hypothetical protein